MKRAIAAVSLSLFAAFAAAQSGGMQGMDMKDMDMKGMNGMKGMDQGSEKSETKSHHAAGTVKSVDAENGNLTLNHGPVASMGWPAMTMTFKAGDKKMLQSIKPGQKLAIAFRQQGKDYVITQVKNP